MTQVDSMAIDSIESDFDNKENAFQYNNVLSRTPCTEKGLTDPFVDTNRNSSIRRLLDPTDNNVILSVNNENNVDKNLSLPSPCSSVPDTPEATTTKEIPKPEGSPILRRLKRVLSMFRPSQSPILPADVKSSKLHILSPIELNKSEVETIRVSTPVSESKQRDVRSSPLKDSLVFNDNIERELLWKNETTIFFKDEKFPVHKLFFQNPIPTKSTVPKTLETTVGTSKKIKDLLTALEVQVRSLETESADRLAKIKELNERMQEKTKMNKCMALVVEEYERTIASLIAYTEYDKKRDAEERMRLIKERDKQTARLISMEVSFNDLHSRYERSKQIILSCKANEDIYKKLIKEFQDNFSKMQNNYEILKQHATSKLNHANQELEKINRAHEAEVLKMNAMIKEKSCT